MAELISKTYALALFEAGLDLGKVNEFNKELGFLKDVFESERKLLQILSHPKINKVEKKDLLDKLFKEKISLEMLNFLYILIDKRRETYILEIVEQYKGLFNEHENIVKVDFSSIGIKGKAKVMDLWSNEDLGLFHENFSRSMPQHRGGLYRVSPVK